MHGSSAPLGRFRRRLRRLLELADLGQRPGVDHVGDRLVHAVLAVAARGLAPPRRCDAALLAQQRREDLRLLRTEAGQRDEPGVQLLAVGDVAPDQGDVAVVGLDERGAQRLHPARHRLRVAVQRARGGEQRDERLGIVLGDHPRVEVVAAQPACELGGRPERVFHGDLLVEQHPDQERERVAVQQRVGVRDPGRAAAAQAEGSAGAARRVGKTGRSCWPISPPTPRRRLRGALTRARYTTDGVRALLGPSAHAALGRGEPEPAFRAAADADALGVLVRLLLLGSVEPDAAVAAALAPLTPGRRRGGRPARPGRRPRRARLARRARPAPLRRGRRPGLVGALRPRRPPPGPRPRHRRRRGLGDARRRDRPATGGHGARPGHGLRGAGPARDPARPAGSPAPTSRRGRWRSPRPRSRSTTSTSNWWTGRGSRPSPDGGST